ncbi:glycosyltransferase [Modestobacter sp. NPDC049651]|uniref:glycosyltransferase n=1 Tax=unclassified Modestobacter TaxID=2643866 RepID=UPI0033F4B5C8
MSRVDVLAVVVPARDEAALLPGCLAALAAAAAHPGLTGVAVGVLVVADGCTDRTAAVAEAAGVAVVPGAGRGVGAARDLGARQALRTAAREWVPADRVWLACTDADSRVPPDWLVGQRTAAESGADAVAGTVVVDDWSGFPPGAEAGFTAGYDGWRAVPGAEHPHVHGANLGVRGSAYLAAGGFPPVLVGEDHGLVDALVAAGAEVLRSPVAPVRTSSRRVARARHGFAADLDRLASRLAAD